MPGRTKADIEFHSDRMCLPAHPAVNVKVYSYPDAWDVADALGCTEEQAQHALNIAFTATQEVFWNDTLPNLVEGHLVPIFGTCEVYGEGRQSGWVVLTNQGDRAAVEDEWDAILTSCWHRFAEGVRQEVKYVCSWNYVLTLIKANGWHED